MKAMLRGRAKSRSKGLRRIGTAAIELTWNYYYPDRPVPLGVSCWRSMIFFDLRDPRVEPFEYAMQSFGQNRPQDKIWQELLTGIWMLTR